jgi:hypothetical protein
MSRSGGRDWRLYAEDILEACGKIRRFIAGLDYDAFSPMTALETRSSGTSRSSGRLPRTSPPRRRPPHR